MLNAYCLVSTAPLRAEPSDKTEMISQILFGENLKIIEQNEKWSKVICGIDNYEGWMDNKQYKIIEKELTYQFLSFHHYHACQLNDESIPLVMGSNLPDFDGLHFKIAKQKFMYNGNAIDIKQNPLSNIKKVAIKYLNTPYLWGGRSPFGIDCSGFTQMVYRFFNVFLPRDAYQQAVEGETINFVSEGILGDLAFFGNEERITHVGIILENQKIIHASGKVRIDTLDHVGIFNAEEKKYTHFLKTIKRYI